MSETHGIGLRGAPVDERRPEALLDAVPIAALMDGTEVPDGWGVIHELEGRFVPGPAPEGARRFGDLSEADALAAVERFMAGEPVAELAHARTRCRSG